MARDRTESSGSESAGLAGLGALPGFEAPATSGGLVRSWDYRGRRHLVLWLADADPSCDAVTEAAAHENAIRSEGAELLVVIRGTLEPAERARAAMPLGGTMLADADGDVHALLGAEQPTLLVVGRNGIMYWRTPFAVGYGHFDEAVSWLDYLNILEPECETCAPAWPADMMTEA